MELDVPFRITAVGRAATGRGRRVDLTISRQGQDNASIYLVVVAGDA